MPHPCSALCQSLPPHCHQAITKSCLTVPLQLGLLPDLPFLFHPGACLGPAAGQLRAQERQALSSFLLPRPILRHRNQNSL